MKKLLVVLALLLIATPDSDARRKRRKRGKRMSKSWKRPYGMAGCGLGSIVMGKRGSQVLAATTNGTGWNNTFGISFGTSNCMDGPMEQVASKMDRFINANKIALAADIARGEGEHINALAGYMNCSNEKALGRVLQSDFSEIFSDAKVPANEITDGVISSVLSSDNVSGTCKIDNKDLV